MFAFFNGAYEIMETAKDYSYFMLIPQTLETANFWDKTKMRAAFNSLYEFIFEIQVKYRIDADSIYITGLSIGASGMWEMLIQYPDIFAAGISVCGGT